MAKYTEDVISESCRVRIVGIPARDGVHFQESISQPMMLMCD